jgi:adenylate cyclase
MVLRKQKVVVGRDPACDVVIPNRVVSGKHCELEFLQGHWQVTDLQSRNGTFVDGMGYLSKWVFPGHILGFSTLRYRMEYVGQGERPNAKDDDVPVMSKKSLMQRAGLTEDRLNNLASDQEEAVRPRWRIDDV